MLERPPQHRIIRALKWAAPAPTKVRPPGRLTGSQLQGLRYEARLGTLLGPAAIPGQWFQFQDGGGLGVCQPDYLIPRISGPAGHQCMLIVECKLTWTSVAHLQLEELYLPVHRAAYPDVWIVGVQVARNLTTRTPQDQICVSLGGAISKAWNGGRAVWHWLR